MLIPHHAHVSLNQYVSHSYAWFSTKVQSCAKPSMLTHDSYVSPSRAMLPILGTVSPGGSSTDSSPDAVPSPPSTAATLGLLNPSLAAVQRAHKRHSISSLSSQPRSAPPAPHHRHSVELSPTSFNGPLLVTTCTTTPITVSTQTPNKPSGNVAHVSACRFVDNYCFCCLFIIGLALLWNE